jgi:hypothetical protein
MVGKRKFAGREQRPDKSKTPRNYFPGVFLIQTIFTTPW